MTEYVTDEEMARRAVPIHYNEILLVRERLGITCNVPTDYPYAEPPMVRVQLEQMFDALQVTVEQSIWSQTLKHIELPYPADWWQAFKKRWFPRWAKRRWPVVRETYVIDVKALWPHLAFCREAHTATLAIMEEVKEG